MPLPLNTAAGVHAIHHHAHHLTAGTLKIA